MLGTTNASVSQASINRLSISINGTQQLVYNGKEEKSLDISLSSLGAASSSHNHDSIYSKLNHTHSYLPLSGGTLTNSIAFSTQNSQTLVGISGQVAANDFWRIGGAGVDNVGYLEIATADDGNDPIYVRQYTGVWGTITRTATLLDVNGNTSFPGAIWEGGVQLANKYAAKEHSHPFLPAAGGTMYGQIQMITHPIAWNDSSDFATIHFDSATSSDNGHLYITLGDDPSPAAIFRWKMWDTGLYTIKSRMTYNGIQVENGANYYTDSQVGMITAVQSGAPNTRTLWAY